LCLGVAAFSALIGVLSTALLISVLAQKLLLTRWEKYIYNFVLNVELAKERKNQAANVIKFAVKTWYLKRMNKSSSMESMKVQWKLLRSIDTLQQVKQEQRKLIDGCVVLADVFNLQRNSLDHIERIGQNLTVMKSTLDQWDDKFCHINHMMNNLQSTVNLLFDRIR
jgi:SepF-like predicted cell division protein (DUF552 family)